MKTYWENLTDEVVQRADAIAAVDPGQQRAVQIWGQEFAGSGAYSDYPSRIETLAVLLPRRDFGKLKDRVRRVKGHLPAVVAAGRPVETF